jgi:hypothetical protein
MRKVVMLVAMLAMALAVAAPAFAQSVTELEQEAGQFGVVDDSVCSQVTNVGVQQFNAGNQTAVGVAFADADATAGAFGNATAVATAHADAVNVGNAAGVSAATGNVCLNNFGGGWWDGVLEWLWWWF